MNRAILKILTQRENIIHGELHVTRKKINNDT